MHKDGNTATTTKSETTTAATTTTTITYYCYFQYHYLRDDVAPVMRYKPGGGVGIKIVLQPLQLNLKLLLPLLLLPFTTYYCYFFYHYVRDDAARVMRYTPEGG